MTERKLFFPIRVICSRERKNAEPDLPVQAVHDILKIINRAGLQD
jgi:hypothetical protein